MKISPLRSFNDRDSVNNDVINARSSEKNLEIIQKWKKLSKKHKQIEILKSESCRSKKGSIVVIDPVSGQ